MGKSTGFLEYNRVVSQAEEPLERIKHYHEFHVPLAKDQQQIQGARCMDCGVPFCQSGMLINGMASGCPLNNLVPEWNDLVYLGKWEQALYRLLKTNNFPEFTGRVCPAPCEAACTCGLNNDPVTIKENELGIIETGFEKGYIKPKKPQVRTGKRIAVIGSGPSGLAAADQLNIRGHLVTVFERNDRPGGLLMYGIPNMKLEKEIINRRLHLMEEEGVQFVTEADIGNNYSAEKIREDFDCVLLACGASQPRDIQVAGREGNGIYFAVDFLRATTKSLLDSNLSDGAYISAKNKRVLVIGGGDTGNDCVGTALRHGCTSVIQLEMMPEPPKQRMENNPWPQWPKVLKTDYGQEEAIAAFGKDPRLYQTTVEEFLLDENGNVKGARIVGLESKKDASGRMAMVPIDGTQQVLDVDLVLIAAGFLGSQSYVTESFGVEVDQRTNVKTEDGKYATNVEGIFTAGDMHRGQSLVVWAIQEGRRAAKEIDAYLMGYTNLQ